VTENLLAGLRTEGNRELNKTMDTYALESLRYETSTHQTQNEMGNKPKIRNFLHKN
jgi:hypothetical protein